MYNPKGRPKTRKGKAWRALVKKHGVLAAAKRWRRRGRARGRRRHAANPRHRRNQVMPYFAFNRSRNPYVKRHKRASRKITVPRYYRRKRRANPMVKRHYRRPRKARSRRRYYRRNQVMPYFAFNPQLRQLTAPLGDLTKPDFWLKSALPVAGGALGTDIMAAQASKLLQVKYEGIAKHGLKVASAAGLAGVAGMVLGKDVGNGVLIGGLATAIYGMAYDVIGGDQYVAMTKGHGIAGLSGLGQDISTELKSRISEAIKREVQGAGMSQAEIPGQMPGVGDFVTKEYIQAAPRLGSGMNEYLTAEQLEPAPMLATMDNFSEVSI